MPKVQINRTQSSKVRAPGESPDAPATYDQDDPVLHVTWRSSPEGAGHVQFCAVVDTAFLAALVAQAQQAEQVHTTFWFPTMRRHEINDAVRALRTARDKALGADA